ncbi:TPA: hypothetical protein SJ142_003795 [Yersinia enterocolitica]|nr:hypothetical protein [Yersinia enterocolitica]
MSPVSSKVLHSFIYFNKDSKPEECYITIKGNEHSADLLHPELYKPKLKIENIDKAEYEVAFSHLSNNEKLAVRRWTMTEVDTGFYSDGEPALEHRGFTPCNYDLNRKLYRNEPLSHSEKEFVKDLNSALAKLPRVMGDFLRLSEYSTNPTSNPWINGTIEVGDIVTNTPAFMSASNDWSYAEDTIQFSDISEDTNTYAIFKFVNSEQFTPLLEGTASLAIAENEHLASIGSTFRVLGISHAKPIKEHSDLKIRVGVLLEDAFEQRNAKNIHTGELV